MTMWKLLYLFFLSPLLFSEEAIDYRGEMRSLVISLSDYGRNTNPRFILIPQNGHELLTLNGESSGVAANSYIDAIDGQGREDLFYGYSGEGVATSQKVINLTLPYLQFARSKGLKILVTDYCMTPYQQEKSIDLNRAQGFLIYPSMSRGLDFIVPPPLSNNNDISSLRDAENFLYLINPLNFSSRRDYLLALGQTDHDILIIDLFDNDGLSLTSSDLKSLRYKPGGGTRLILAYMSIGEAEEYRYYWREEWLEKHPLWLAEENRMWMGNHKVHYWQKEWQQILFGSENSYLDRILKAEFDGVYLDIIDAFEYFEK